MFSYKFLIKTVYKDTKGKCTYYKQYSKNNLDEISEPEIKQTDEDPYTSVYFYPDLTMGHKKIRKILQNKGFN